MQQFVDTIRPSLSPLRLERYRPRGNGSDLEMVTNYYWNVALAQALLCPIGSVEIMLRNTIHDTLTRSFGAANWYDQRGLLEEKQQRQLGSAKSHIGRSGRTITPERVVSSLSFGFWVTLLSRPYDARLWRANRAANLKAAFPFVPKRQRQRAIVHAQYNDLLTLRNLAFHHEPIYDRTTLLTEHAAIYIGIAWIKPKMVAPTQLFDHFLETYANGRQLVETRIWEYLGT